MRGLSQPVAHVPDAAGTGTARPLLSTLVRLAKALRVSVTELLGETMSMRQWWQVGQDRFTRERMPRITPAPQASCLSHSIRTNPEARCVVSSLLVGRSNHRACGIPSLCASRDCDARQAGRARWGKRGLRKNQGGRESFLAARSTASCPSNTPAPPLCQRRLTCAVPRRRVV